MYFLTIQLYDKSKLRSCGHRASSVKDECDAYKDKNIVAGGVRFGISGLFIGTQRK